MVFLCSNLGNTPVGATVRECPPSPGQVDGDIVAGDVLPVADGEPPTATPIIGAGDLEGLKLLIDQGAVYANVHTPAHATGEIRAQLRVPIAADLRAAGNGPRDLRRRPALVAEEWDARG